MIAHALYRRHLRLVAAAQKALHRQGEPLEGTEPPSSLANSGSLQPAESELPPKALPCPLSPTRMLEEVPARPSACWRAGRRLPRVGGDRPRTGGSQRGRPFSCTACARNGPTPIQWTAASPWASTACSEASRSPTGSRRINEYKMLLDNVEMFGLKPSNTAARRTGGFSHRAGAADPEGAGPGQREGSLPVPAGTAGACGRSGLA